jgi:hypothetical protein
MLQKIGDFIRQYKWLILICVFGLLARVAYVVLFADFFAKAYLGRDTLFYPGGDFGTSLNSFRNLIYHGTYSANLNDALGAFNRMPGYSFFVGLISLVFSEPYNMYVVSGLQILIDCIAIALVYAILYKRFQCSEKVSLLGAIIYAAYPIAIIWTPVLFSDSIGAFFSLWILYSYLSNPEKKYKWLLLGLLIGFAMLFRPQALLSILVVGIMELWINIKNLKYYFKCMLLMGVGIALTYGTYPARNILLQHRFVLFQDLRGSGSCWNDATVNYMQYVYSVQSHWEPAWSSVMQNRKFEIDRAAYAVAGDSIILDRAVKNAQQCSYAFSCWSGYWTAERTANPACDSAIAADFALLRAHQMKQNAFHFWVILPIENLKKCLFKSEISHKKNGGFVASLVPVVFYYRSLLILLGILACVIAIRRRQNTKANVFILLSFFSWYLLISVGTMAQLRNIEMRYLLPVDVLLVVPVALLFTKLLFVSKKES